MKEILWLKTLCLFVASILVAAPATAFDTLASDFAFSNLQNKLLDKRLSRRSSDELDTADAMAAVRFASDSARTQANLRSFVERTSEPKAKADLQRLIQTQPGIVDEIGNAMKSRYGLDPHNFADVYATWWIAVCQLSQKQSADPDIATVSAVRDQVHAALLDTPDFLSLDDVQRQEIAESLLLQALLMSESSLQARNQPDLQNQLAVAATRVAQNSGIDLTLVQLTPQGFVLR